MSRSGTSTVTDPLNHTTTFGYDTQGQSHHAYQRLEQDHDSHGQCLRREKYLVFAQTHRVSVGEGRAGTFETRLLLPHHEAERGTGELVGLAQLIL